MVRRQYYLDKIKPFLGKGIVKAITGLRRVGKSVFVDCVSDCRDYIGVCEIC